MRFIFCTYCQGERPDRVVGFCAEGNDRQCRHNIYRSNCEWVGKDVFVAIRGTEEKHDAVLSATVVAVWGTN